MQPRIDGKIVAMGSMTISFAPTDHMNVAGLASGDMIQFTFEVHRPDAALTAFQNLPATTTLALE